MVPTFFLGLQKLILNLNPSIFCNDLNAKPEKEEKQLGKFILGMHAYFKPTGRNLKKNIMQLQLLYQFNRKITIVSANTRI